MSQPPNYRVYCLDGVNNIVSGEWVDASTDEEAIAAVREAYPGLACEIWERNRLVAKIEAKRLFA